VADYRRERVRSPNVFFELLVMIMDASPSASLTTVSAPTQHESSVIWEAMVIWEAIWKHARRLAILAALAMCSESMTAQDLAPRAYVISPVHSNAVTLTYSFYDGGLLLPGAIPITGATGRYNVPIFTYYHSLSMFGRSANVTASLPYAVGHFQADVLGEPARIYRSGLLDSSYRLSVNLKGGPAMGVPEFSKWKQKTLIGVSVRVLAPTGQYDHTKLVNWGSNRWSFKPELGFSKRWNKILVDAYGGAWFYTLNSAYFDHNQYIPGTQSQSESPIGSFEGHLSYDFKSGTWVSLDGNLWFGGTTSLNGVSNPATRQVGSRIGGTGALRLSSHQSVKISYSEGTYIRYGGNYQNVSVAWQYSCLGRPK
jgi:hypothetical protein